MNLHHFSQRSIGLLPRFDRRGLGLSYEYSTSFPSAMTHTNTARTEKLSKLVDGLFWMSESDYPWQVFVWQTPRPLSREQLLQLTHHDPGTLIMYLF